MIVQSFTVGKLETNGYVVYDPDTRHGIVIDPGAEAELFLHFIREQGIEADVIVLTHAHFDHCGAAEEIRRTLGIPLLVGRDDEPFLRDPMRNVSAFWDPEHPVNLKADGILCRDDRVPVGGAFLQVAETPGHTPGGICLVGDDVIFTGDTLFCGSVGRSDFPGGDSETLQRSVSYIAALPGDKTVYPGHGPQTTLSAERETNFFLTPWR